MLSGIRRFETEGKRLQPGLGLNPRMFFKLGLREHGLDMLLQFARTCNKEDRNSSLPGLYTVPGERSHRWSTL